MGKFKSSRYGYGRMTPKKSRGISFNMSGRGQGFGPSARVGRFGILFYLIWLFVLEVFQPTIMQWLSVFNVSADLFLVFVICNALKRGKLSGGICGFLFGIAFDLLTGRMIGISGICYMYAGFAVGFVNDKITADEGCVATAVFTACAGVFCGIIYLMGYSLAYGSPGFFYALIVTVLPKALYSALAAFVLAKPMGASFNFIDNRSMF